MKLGDFPGRHRRRCGVIATKGEIGMIVRTSAELARLIDHTTLRSDVTAAEVEQYCQEAIEWNFASVCVNPIHVPRVAACLAGSAVRTCSVIGLPLGASPTALKRAELEGIRWWCERLPRALAHLHD